MKTIIDTVLAAAMVMVLTAVLTALVTGSFLVLVPTMAGVFVGLCAAKVMLSDLWLPPRKRKKKK